MAPKKEECAAAPNSLYCAFCGDRMPVDSKAQKPCKEYTPMMVLKAKIAARNGMGS